MKTMLKTTPKRLKTVKSDNKTNQICIDYEQGEGDRIFINIFGFATFCWVLAQTYCVFGRQDRRRWRQRSPRRARPDTTWIGGGRWSHRQKENPKKSRSWETINSIFDPGSLSRSSTSMGSFRRQEGVRVRGLLQATWGAWRWGHQMGVWATIWEASWNGLDICQIID